MFARYQNALNSRPLFTKCWTAGILAGIGDIMAQGIERKYHNPTQKFSVSRWLKFAGFSATFGAANIHVWLTHGLTKVDGKVIQSLAPFVKVVLDQALFAPYILTTFFLGMNFLDGKGIQEGLETIQTKLWPTLKKSWTFWPVVMIVNFSVVPVHQQAIVALVAGLGWRTYLSYVNYGPKKISI